ncbi:MAG: hypothetical protein HC842_04150 [Cytophagales bacterium]|nr:hypothetical protein [Cytophagales bacterium]
MKYANVVFILLLLLSAVVQYNDPDPGLWITTYALGALLIYLRHWAQLSRDALWVAVSACALVAIGLWPDQYAGLEGKMMKEKPQIELARESLGLGLMGLFLFINIWVRPKKA